MAKGIFFIVIVACWCYLGKGANSKPSTTKDDSKIYFPDDLNTRSGEDGVPDECKGKTYCTVKPANYPQEKYNKLFNNTKAMEGPQLIIEPVVSIDDKIGESEGDGCETEVLYKPLYQIRTKRGDWRTVIQAPEQNYLQKVRIENCMKEDAPCFQGIGYGSEIVTGCVQKYSVWEFIVDDGNGGSEKVKSELPICCSCHYKINYANRIGTKK